MQPFEVLLHHDVVGDNQRCVDALRFQFLTLSVFSTLFALFDVRQLSSYILVA
jgi:hypothetical protein